jgi:hypothetical protein
LNGAVLDWMLRCVKARRTFAGLQHDLMNRFEPRQTNQINNCSENLISVLTETTA